MLTGLFCIVEFEGKEQPTSPANTGGANSENVTDSAPQVITVVYEP